MGSRKVRHKLSTTTTRASSSSSSANSTATSSGGKILRSRHIKMTINKTTTKVTSKSDYKRKADHSIKDADESCRMKKLRTHLMTTRSLGPAAALSDLDSVLSLPKKITKTKTLTSKSLQHHEISEKEKRPINNAENSAVEEPVPINSLPPEILTKILEYLNPTDLLTCRLVRCHQWKDVSTNILGSRKCFTISLVFHSSSRHYIKTKGFRTSTTLTVTELTSCLDKIPALESFPCSKFTFDGGPLGMQEAQIFFRRHGHRIRHLKLNLYSYYPTSVDKKTSLKTVGRILQSCRDLESLHLLCPDHSEKKNDLMGKFFSTADFTLSKLKRLQIMEEEGNIVLTEILKAATHLEKFENFQIKNIQPFIATGKIHTVKELRLSSQSIKHYEIFASQPIQRLNSLELESTQYSDVDQMCTVLVKILTSNRTTLQRLKLYSSSFGSVYQTGFRWPRLEHVKELELHFWQNLEHSMFPRGFDFGSTFPNVTKIHLGVSFNFKWDTFLPTCQRPVTSVNHLIIHYIEENSAWMEQLAATFPRVKTIEVQKVGHFSVVGKAIWSHFPLLTRLKFHMYVHYEFGAGVSQASALDATLTGFSDETCRRLRLIGTHTGKDLPGYEPLGIDLAKIKEAIQLPPIEEGIELPTNEAAECLRENPSIVALQELKVLDIHLSGSLAVTPHPRFRPIISVLSQRYAFDLMPRLERVNIFTSAFSPDDRAKVEAVLAPLAPFVRLHFD